MSKCFICGNDSTGVTGDNNVCFSCYSKPKESTLISRIQELDAQVAEIATDRLELLKRAEAAEAQLAGLKGLVAVHLGEFSNESEEALMKALDDE